MAAHQRSISSLYGIRYSPQPRIHTGVSETRDGIHSLTKTSRGYVQQKFHTGMPNSPLPKRLPAKQRISSACAGGIAAARSTACGHRSIRLVGIKLIRIAYFTRTGDQYLLFIPQNTHLNLAAFTPCSMATCTLYCAASVNPLTSSARSWHLLTPTEDPG